MLARVEISGAGTAEVRGRRASVRDEEEDMGKGFEGGSLQAWQAGGPAGQLQNVKLKTPPPPPTKPSKGYSHRKTAGTELLKSALQRTEGY